MCRPPVRPFSRARAARRDGPDRFDSAVPYADIPVVQVDRRIAMTGDEPDLFAEPQALRLGANLQLAVLIGDIGDLDILEAVDPGRTFLAAVGLQPRVHDGAVVCGHA